MNYFDDLRDDEEDIDGLGAPEPVDTIAGPSTPNPVVYDRIKQVRQGTSNDPSSQGEPPMTSAPSARMSPQDLAAMEYSHGVGQDASLGRALNAVASGFGAHVDNSGYDKMSTDAAGMANKFMDRSARVAQAVEARKAKDAAALAAGDRWQKSYDQRDRAINATNDRIKEARDEKSQEKLNQLQTPLGIANSEDDAKKLKEAYESKANFDNKIQEMIDLREKHGGGAILNREDVARGKQLSKDLLLEYKNMAKLGVLSQSDEKIINAIIPEDPLQFNGVVESLQGQDSTLHRLKAFKGDSDKDFATKVQTRIREGGGISPPSGNSIASTQSSPGGMGVPGVPSVHADDGKNKQVVRQFRNKKTGQIKYVYSDGTEEIK